MEFPLYQILATWFTELFGFSSDVSARLLSLFLFQVSAVIWAVLVKKWFSPIVSLVTLGLYQFLGYGFVFADEPLIEWLPVALVLLTVLLYDRYLRFPRMTLAVLMSVTLSLAFLTKITSGLALAPLLLIPLLNLRKASELTCSLRRALGVLVITLTTALLSAAVWTRYSDHIKANQPLTEFMTSSNLRIWNFGTVQQRLDPDAWVALVTQWGLVGSLLAFPIAAVAAIILWNWAPATLIFPTVPILSVGIFFNLYVRHDYYQIAIYPVLVGIVALAVVGIVKAFSSKSRRNGLLIGVTICAALIAGSWNTSTARGGIVELVTVVSEPSWMRDLLVHGDEDQGIVAIGCNWNPTLAAVTKRPTLMVPSVDAADYFQSGIVFFCNEPPEGYDLYVADSLPTGIDLVQIKDGLYSFQLPKDKMN